MTDDNDGATMGNVIWIDEGRIKHRLGEMVGGRVDEGLNAMPDAEADRFRGGSIANRASHGRMPMSSGTTGPFAPNGRGDTTSLASRRRKTTPPVGSGHTTTKDQTWGAAR